MYKVGAMTIGINEEATLPFLIRETLNFVDKYVYIDTGSSDNTFMLLNTFFEDEIKFGKLIIKQIDISPDLKIHKARQAALDELQDMDFFFKFDADHIPYGNGIFQARKLINSLPIETTYVTMSFRELYQYKARNTIEWLNNIIRLQDFYELTAKNGKPTPPPSNKKIHRVKGAYCQGQWCDETNGLRPEGIFYHNEHGVNWNNIIVSAHYGWARPMDSQIEKAILRYGSNPANWNERVEKLHTEPYKSQRKLREFQDHPAILYSAFAEDIARMLLINE